MLTKERIEESRQLIRKHLVTLHDDGDVDSLFVRFAEIMLHLEDETLRVESWERCSEFILKFSNENEGTE